MIAPNDVHRPQWYIIPSHWEKLNRTEQDYIPGTGHRSQRGTWPNGEAYIVSVHKLRA